MLVYINQRNKKKNVTEIKGLFALKNREKHMGMDQVLSSQFLLLYSIIKVCLTELVF